MSAFNENFSQLGIIRAVKELLSKATLPCRMPCHAGMGHRKSIQTDNVTTASRIRNFLSTKNSSESASDLAEVRRYLFHHRACREDTRAQKFGLMTEFGVLPESCVKRKKFLIPIENRVCSIIHVL